ncbi:hypothetical protein [Curtobacterium luteum]|uniref:hypothetical protein n=1 Tax=Curtobacterium luteum TaxID=33881 RepID=UPI00381E590C
MTPSRSATLADAYKLETWRRRTGNELAIVRRRYVHTDGQQMWVDAIPAVAPGAIWAAMFESARIRAAAQDVICAPANPKEHGNLSVGVRRRLADMGWYLDVDAARDELDDANVLAPQRGKTLHEVFGAIRIRRRLRRWKFGVTGDSLVGETPLTKPRRNLADHNPEWDEAISRTGAILAAPERAGFVDARLKAAGYTNTQAAWVTVIGRWSEPHPAAGQS